jgi:hypothetical protein
MLDLVNQILPGAISGAAIVWLLRGWLTERLKQSISHEYSQKLQTHKTELDAKLQAIRHEYEVNQLRTSLFFDHQRAAFSEILEKIAMINREWWSTGYEEDVGLIESVPFPLYQELRSLYTKHQLFLDSDSIMALELIQDVYRDSLPFRDGDGQTHTRDVRSPYDNAEYLQPRIAALFQKKIGVGDDSRAVRQIALFGSIRVLNRYHFADIGLPATGVLKLQEAADAEEAVMQAERNLPELLEKMRRFQHLLRTGTYFYHQAEASLARYLAILEPAPSASGDA